MFQAKFLDILRSPSSLAAIIGLALLNIAREAHRYPVLAPVDKMGFITFPLGDGAIHLTVLISLATLIIVTVVLAKSSGFSDLFTPIAGLVAASIMTLGYFGKFLMADSAFLRVCSEFTQACGFIILIGWAIILYRNERDRTLLLVAYSFLLSGILQALLLGAPVGRTLVLIASLVGDKRLRGVNALPGNRLVEVASGLSGQLFCGHLVPGCLVHLDRPVPCVIRFVLVLLGVIIDRTCHG